MRRFALISDIHGNLTALDAVLADIRENGPDEIYCLGDLVGYGPNPAGCIDRIRERGIPTVIGNYDDGVGNRRGSCGCYYASDESRADGEASYRFTEPRVDADRARWLAALPRQLRFDVGGRRVLLTHGSPRRINEYLLPDRTDGFLARLAREGEADVVCIGHVHVPYHRRVETEGAVAHYVSAGSVGKPKDGDPRACWAEVALDAETPALDVHFHRVTYDIERVARDMEAAGLPPRLADALRTA